MIDLTHTKVEEFIMTVQTPYRYDVVGSFLRPEKLKQARKDYESKKISREELTQIEDECITDLVQKEKAVGLHVITDGEFRRATWHLDLCGDLMAYLIHQRKQAFPSMEKPL